MIATDILLATDVIARGGYVLNSRAELYIRDTIQKRLAMRNFWRVCAAAECTADPQSERPTAIANQLDKFLAKQATWASSDFLAK